MPALLRHLVCSLQACFANFVQRSELLLTRSTRSLSRPTSHAGQDRRWVGRKVVNVGACTYRTSCCLCKLYRNFSTLYLRSTLSPVYVHPTRRSSYPKASTD